MIMRPKRSDGVRYQRLLNAIAEKDISVKDAMIILCVCRQTALRYLNDLARNKDGHVSGWTKAKCGPYSPVYSVGHGIAVPKPDATARKRAAREVVRKLGTRSLYKKTLLILGLS